MMKKTAMKMKMKRKWTKKLIRCAYGRRPVVCDIVDVLLCVVCIVYICSTIIFMGP